MLILVAGTGIGFSESHKMKKHVDELETLKQIFRCLKSELEYTHAPFEEVFAKLGQKFGGVFGVWLTNTSRRLRDREKATFSNEEIIEICK